MIAARLVLLVAAVAGAVARPFRLPAFVAPALCGVIAVSAGLISPDHVGDALRPLASPLGFLLAAIPLAVLLDRFGYFSALAASFGGGRLLLPGLWVLAAATVAVLNLDAAVVLLTPLYVRVAEKRRLAARFLGFQPVILALLASSVLAVSNLTNLIAVSSAGATTAAIFEHLALPSAVASAVGYALYRGARRIAETNGSEPHDAPSAPPGEASARVVVIGSLVVVLLLVGFVVGPSHGIEPWLVAFGADLVMIVLTRCLPVSSIPLGTALVAAGLAVVAAVAAEGISFSSLLSGTGPLAVLRQAGVAALGANAVNNLPSFLVLLPSLGHHGGASCALWPVLYGVNAGPSLLVTGSLASLLWIDTMRRLGVAVRPAQFLKMGLRVGLPAALAGLLVLMALAPALGCG